MSSGAEQPRTAICLSGGGLTGLDIHTGILLALQDKGVIGGRDLDIYGTSAGAIIGAMLFSGHSPSKILQILIELQTHDVKQRRFLGRLRSAWIDSIYKPEPILRLLETLVDETFESRRGHRITVYATHERNGNACQIREGNLRQAVLASMSISGLWPAVPQSRIQANTVGNLVDGGTSNNLPLPPMYRWPHLDDVYLCISRLALEHAPDSALGRMMRNVDFFLEDQTNDTVILALRLAKKHNVNLHIINPAISQKAGSLKFDHGLIAKARMIAGRMLS